MVDTVTPKLALTKPEIGASADTWGNKLNTNFDILDQRVVVDTDQWDLLLGDGIPASPTGHFIVTRYDNTGTPIDNPFSINRQTGEITVPNKLSANVLSPQVITMPYQALNPAPPGASIANFFVDAVGNACLQKSDGSILYLGVPPGTIAFTGASTADSGWALLEGQLLSRSINPVLFSRYGTTYGAGDGTTFGIPNAKGKVFAHPDGGAGLLTGATLGAILGAQTHTLTTAQLPSHAHPAFIRDLGHSHPYGGSGSNPGDSRNGPIGGGGVEYWPTPKDTTSAFTGVKVWDGATVDTTSPTGGGGSHPIVQPTLVLSAQIKLG